MTRNPSLEQLIAAVQYDLKVRANVGDRIDDDIERNAELRAALQKWLAHGADDNVILKARNASLMPPPVSPEIWRAHQTSTWGFVRGWRKRSYEDVVSKLSRPTHQLLSSVLLADESVRKFDYRGIHADAFYMLHDWTDQDIVRCLEKLEAAKIIRRTDGPR